MQLTAEKSESWLDRPLLTSLALNGEKVILIIIIVLAVWSRFYGLGNRVMSHDENTHVYYSWRFLNGLGFQHDPLMHGPLLFHLTALSYFMFGDNDFTARLPEALFSIASVAFLWYYRRYLGRAGALIGAALMLISPYMLYYGRYARNEAYVTLFGLVTLWGILRYIETGRPLYMYFITAATVLHFTAKETSFIYTAQALLFLGIYLLARITRLPWVNPSYRNRFLMALLAVLVLAASLGSIILLDRYNEKANPPNLTASPTPIEQLQPLSPTGVPPVKAILGILSVLALAVMVAFLIRGYTWKRLRSERSFDLIVVLGTLVLPQLSAFPVDWMGKLLKDTATWSIPTNASQVAALGMTNIIHIALFVIPLGILSVVVGILWNRREWLINAIIWYTLFTLFYTSVFTNGAGFFTGLVGSLGYWLAQQPVQRGSQPWYFYAAIQVPIYEYLPALGTILAVAILEFRRWVGASERAVFKVHPDELVLETANGSLANPVFEDDPSGFQLQQNRFDISQIDDPVTDHLDTSDLGLNGPGEMGGMAEITEAEIHRERIEPPPTLALLVFWAVTSLIAYSIAGEKMPWLTVHIALPLILCAAWGFGQLVEAMDWTVFRQRRGWLILVLVFLFLVSFASVLGSALGPNPPLQGQSLEQLQDTSTFLLSVIAAIASLTGLILISRTWQRSQILILLTIAFFTILALLTARTAYQAAFINYDNANELLVYAHSAGGDKQALAQIEEISRRTTNGLGLAIAYDNETSYPFWWYLRDYTNVHYFGSEPTRSIRDVSAILVGDANFGKVESIIGNSFYKFDYIRLWWPNQDYYNLTWERILNALSDRNLRSAIFQIWLNRDYTQYGEVENRDMSLPNWTPSARMRLYIRKDVAAQIWNYGVAPSAEELGPQDPFTEDKRLELSADKVIGIPGSEPGQFQRPRDLAVAPDGSLYVADTENHRIQHLSSNGEVLQVWGQFGDLAQGSAPDGTFNQPWGIAVSPDGSVFVADTWNHRIQKFTAQGKFITKWGYFGQAEAPDAFWGPRDVAVDTQGRVFVTDTGNKRVVVFDGDGNYLAQFGTTGFNAGEFDEPVGLAIDQAGRIFVADTWNQRIQVFTETDKNVFVPSGAWELVAWFGQSLDNKPYLAVDDKGNVFAVEPEGYRILWFSDTGEALYYWGDYGIGPNQFGMPGSIAYDHQGGVWVTDTGNGRLMHFTLPVTKGPGSE